MTRRTDKFETVAQAIADFNNTVEPVDTIGEYIEMLAYATQVVDYEGHFHGTLADEEKWERWAYAWLKAHSNNPADPNYDECYSDIYKDLYGFRPRW